MPDATIPKAKAGFIRSWLLLAMSIGPFFPASADAQSALEPEAGPATPPPFKLAYDLEAPDRTWELPGFLKEISALSWHPGRGELVTLQDEEGNIFYLREGEVVEEIEFWKDGDYEGIEVVGTDLYAVKSSGTLYRIRRVGQADQEVTKFNDFLNPDNDVEGLAYDLPANRLLLACKGKAGDGEAFRMKKAVYAFDLVQERLHEEPVYVISFEAIHEYLDVSPTLRQWEKLMEFFQPNETDFTFTPSGLAVSPDGDHIYILSTAGKLMVILDRQDGRIVHIEKLSKSMHAQPEGICFDGEGHLYISNEGKKGRDPVIYRFSPRSP